MLNNLNGENVTVISCLVTWHLLWVIIFIHLPFLNQALAHVAVIYWRYFDSSVFGCNSKVQTRFHLLTHAVLWASWTFSSAAKDSLTVHSYYRKRNQLLTIPLSFCWINHRQVICLFSELNMLLPVQKNYYTTLSSVCSVEKQVESDAQVYSF